MSIQFHQMIFNEYMPERYNAILRVEEKGGVEKLTPYNDGKGLVTIGVGFNLSDDNVRSRVLQALGITDPVTIIKLNDYLSKEHIGDSDETIQGRLSVILGGTAFEFDSADQVKFVFDGLCRTDGLAQTYEDKVDAFAVEYGLGAIPDSRERIALLSLAWNTKDGQTSLLGKGLGTAMAQGNRAEAWYEIRYNSNRDKSEGIAKRRYYESEVFGLYESNDSASNQDEALQVYRMCTAHRDKILQYEETYGNLFGKIGIRGDQIAKANTDYELYYSSSTGFVNTLTVELSSSADVLMNEYIKDEYGVARTFNPLNIQVASDKLPALYGEDTTTRTGSNNDLLIGQDGGNDFLVGGKGDDLLIGQGGRDILSGGDDNDTLVGGEGADTLEGGIGDDTMIGGAGEDTYIIEGHDCIIDTGHNKIVWNGKLIAGAFLYIDELDAYQFISDDAKYQFEFHSPGQLTLSAEDSVTFVNQTSAAGFLDKDFGITLQDAPPDDFDITLTGTASRDEMGILDFGTNPINWKLTYTSFPGGVPSATPFYSEYLTATAPRLNITGGDSGDYLFGFARHDEISGGAGGDIIAGHLGFWNNKPVTLAGDMEGDLLDGGDGGDWIEGSGGVDQIIGGEGNDFLSGFDEDDIIRGDAGNDVLAGGSHADTLSGGDGDDLLIGEGYFIGSLALTLDNLASLGVDFTASAAGYYTGYVSNNFTINTDAPNGGDDILLGGAGRDWLEGGVGSDTLDGGTESDAVFGGDGDDWLYGGSGNDWLVGDNGDLTGTGNDTLDGGAGDDLLYGLAGNDTLSGGDGADQLFGFADTDTLSGGVGEDTLFGGAGNDVLYGGTSDDYLAGESGDDDYVFNSGDGTDVVSDSLGNNRITFSSISQITSLIIRHASLQANGDVLLDTGSDLMIGYTDNDGVIIKGDNLTNYTFVLGNDILYSSTNFLSYVLPNTNIKYGSPKGDELNGNAGNEILFGGDGNDQLYGKYGSNKLFGENGNDSLVSGPGADLLNGGSGQDVANYYHSQAALYANLLTGEVQGGDADGDILVSVEGVWGSFYDDTIVGDDQSNNLRASQGNDIVYGLGGDDYLADYVPGSSGDDEYYGGAGNDYISTEGGSDLLVGNEGNDRLIGGGYGDKYLFNLGDGTDFISIYYQNGGSNSIVFGGSSGITFSNIVVSYVTIINTDPYTTTIFGMQDVTEDDNGTDLLIKYGTDDAIAIKNGGYLIDMSYDLQDTGNTLSQLQILELINPNHPYGSADDQIEGSSGVDRFYGGDGNDIIIGYGGNDCLFGEGGNDTLYGGIDSDSMAGGIGDDKYVVDNEWDVVAEKVDEGIDTVQSSRDNYKLTDNVENLTLIIGASVFYGTGNLLDNILIGNNLDNNLSGMGGNDILDGGYGRDTMLGGQGDDTYVVNSLSVYGTTPSDAVIENANEGTDTVRSCIAYALRNNVENLILTDDTVVETRIHDMKGTGNALNNILVGNSVRNILDGGVGVDSMAGGKDDDTYIVDDIGDTVTEYANEGTDFVQSSVTYTLGANLENLVLTEDPLMMPGAASINGYGNALNNILIGNRSTNVLDGRVGADTMTGGLGDDNYVIDNSGDIVVENANEGTDHIATYISLTLTNNVENLTLAGTSAINGTGNTLNNVLIGNNGLNTLTGGSGSDRLYGKGGNDKVIGGEGNDYLYGDVGDDELSGGYENDYLRGGVGSDLLDGGEGIDSADYSDSVAAVTINLGINIATGGSASGDTLISIENLYGSSYDDILTGDSKNNTLLGRDGDDWLSGNEGNDSLRGESGTDQLVGGLGNDTLRGGLGNDILDGGDGIDIADYRDSLVSVMVNLTTGATSGGTSEGDSLFSIENLYGSESSDILTGSAENNTLIGYSDDDVLHGMGGNDNLRGEVGSDQLISGLGNDTLRGGLGNDILDGGDGIDFADYRDSLVSVMVNLTTGATSGGSAEGDSLVSIENLYGSESADLFTGSAGNNTLIGYGDDDVLQGMEGNDNLRGEVGSDQLIGGLGNDTLRGGLGNDFLDGGDGLDTADYRDSSAAVIVNLITGTTSGGTAEGDCFVSIENLFGSENTDTFTGSAVSNNLIGYGGDDVLQGMEGNDNLRGEVGADQLFGGLGNDTLIGGAGNDLFVFDSMLDATANKDFIKDFETGLDKIQMDKTIFTSLIEEGTLSSDFFKSGTTAVASDADDYFLYNTTSGALFYDMDGNGQGVATQFATLTTKPAITANDFLITT